MEPNICPACGGGGEVALDNASEDAMPCPTCHGLPILDGEVIDDDEEGL